ncbi:hypothetical protein PanWU01x14_292890 [Parasponia andersonii]|uniref:Uncharacterized protein n=1 Tax=Parasponia andersonii TaxID=3476 RepID=A0A2P5AWR2_PARAD|nr:hypothetical protein PanWU01x14_292890 [Parasponia andersonii]
MKEEDLKEFRPNQGRVELQELKLYGQVGFGIGMMPPNCSFAIVKLFCVVIQRPEYGEGDNRAAGKKKQLCSLNYGSNETEYSDHARVSLQKTDSFFRQVYFRKRNKALLASRREDTENECNWLEESQTMSEGESDGVGGDGGYIEDSSSEYSEY